MAKLFMKHNTRLLLLIPLERALPALLFNSAQTLGSCGQEFRAVCPDESTKKHSLGAGMGRVTSHRDPLASLDRAGCPTDFGQIQPASELDRPLHDLTGLIGDVHGHRRVRDSRI